MATVQDPPNDTRADVPLPPADVARAHRDAWAEALCAGLTTLALTGDRDPARDLRRALDDDQAKWEAVTWLDGAERAPTLEASVEVLREAIERGLRVVMAVPNTRRAALVLPDPAHHLGWDEVRALAAALGASVVPQHLAEGSLIGPATSVDAKEEALTGRLLASEVTEPDDAHAWLLVANAPSQELAGVQGSLQLAGARLHYSQLTALEAANVELRRANTRLARAALGKHDAAAAVVVGRLRAAEAAIVELEQRLELEKQVAFQNDALFQQARKKLEEPRYKAVDTLRARLYKIPGTRRLAAVLMRRFVR